MNIKRIRQQAQDENTAPEILVDLANSEDQEILRHVASNPNTPIETLEKLGKKFPDEIIANPIFDLFLLENPESKFIQLSLARSSTTSEEKLNELASHKDVEILEAVAENENTTLKTLEQLAIQKFQHQGVLRAIVKNSNTSANLIDKMYKNDRYNTLTQLVLENSRTSDATLEKIVFSNRCWDNMNINGLILKHPNASQNTIHILKLIIGSWDRDTPRYVLEKLANHKYYWIRSLVAQYPNTPIELLSRLGLLDSSIVVRQSVAANPNTPNELLNRLNLDNDLSIKLRLAENPNTPIELLNRLGLNNDLSIKLRVAANLNTPIKLLNRLGLDNSTVVRRSVAANPNTPSEILKKLATSTDYRVREGVAEHPKTPLEILDELKYDKNRSVRLKIADNPNISLKIMECLAKDSVISKSQTIIEKSEISVARLGGARMDTIITGVHSHLVRATVAKRNDISEKIATILSQDNSSEVRRNIAANSNVPFEIIKLLSKDSDPDVYVTAVKTLMYHRKLKSYWRCWIEV